MGLLLIPNDKSVRIEIDIIYNRYFLFVNSENNLYKLYLYVLRPEYVLHEFNVRDEILYFLSYGQGLKMLLILLYNVFYLKHYLIVL